MRCNRLHNIVYIRRTTAVNPERVGRQLRDATSAKRTGYSGLANRQRNIFRFDMLRESIGGFSVSPRTISLYLLNVIDYTSIAFW